MPVFNEARHLPPTLDALTAALDGSGFDADLIVVDDGSTDGSGEVARTAVHGHIPARVLRQPNRGRFEARRSGLDAAEGAFVLFLDARVRLDPHALRFVHDRVADTQAWNAHVRIETDNAFGIFWRLLAELAWRDYFDNPRTTSYGPAEFDRFPKGTTCFLAPRELLLAAFDDFDPRYRDVRMANDDTPILRTLAARQRISVSPEFACVYEPRSSLGEFLRHSFRRGIVFVDGHGVPDSRFFPAVVAFFPLSAMLAIAVLRRPVLAPAALVACGMAAAAYGLRAKRAPREVATLAVITPLYALGHGLGMWRGLSELVRNRVHS
ncbi:MAG TPA: glycosyltransferase [Gaiellaceae bacterium]|jgi:prepilin-type processing-associated H-X9-DG protein|nr:glycosyltransferase [Gaiellaceae bacterium]